MGIRKERKIDKILDFHRPGTVLLELCLERLGVSYRTQKRYHRKGWLERFDRGVFKRPGEEVDWKGGLYALQAQAGIPIHVGARTALVLRGIAQEGRRSVGIVFLFSPLQTTFPRWYRRQDWGVPVEHVKTSFLPEQIGLIDQEEKTFRIKISTPERAILECLYLASGCIDILDCYQLVKGFVNLCPRRVQELLENCSSIKVKRLFLYMAEKAGHSWMERLDQERIDLGNGVRSLVKGGVYVSKYKFIVPKELAADMLRNPGHDHE